MRDYEWHRSSYCASGACVQVALGDDGSVLVRDSKRGDDSPVLSFTSGAWARVLQDITDGNLPDGAGFLTDGSTYWGPLEFTADEWFAFVEDLDEFTYDRLFTGDEAGSGFRGVARSGHAATGAGAIAVPPVPVAAPELLACDCPGVAGKWGATGRLPEGHVIAQVGTRSYLAHAVPPVPVAAQPRYILDKDAILNLALRLADTAVAAALERRSCNPDAASRYDAKFDELLAAIGAALTPVPNVEPEPAWGSGPLVKHVTETPAEPQMPYLTGQPVSFVDDGDGQATRS